MNKRMGRPKLPKDNARSIVFQVRISPKEQRRIKAAACKSGKGPTEWARDALLSLAPELNE
jgi:hypothetical protein